jgi:heavy metal sensor kinase
MMRLSRLPIRTRLTLWYLLLLFGVLALFGGALYLALHLALYRSTDDVLRTSAPLIVNAFEENADGALVGHADRSPELGSGKQGQSFWRVLDTQGIIVEQTGLEDFGSVPIMASSLAAARAGGETLTTLEADDGLVRLYTTPITRDGQVVGFLQSGLALDDVEQTLAVFRMVVLLAIPATLLLTALGGLFLAGRALRPVDAVTRAAASISARDLHQRLDLGLPDDEIGRLARTFNAMLDRLESAFTRQRRFTADASHELRTPLTIIEGTVSLALSRARDADYYRQVLSDVEDAVGRMSHLVNRMLTLARDDVQGVRLDLRTVNISELLSDLVDDMAPLAEAKGLQLRADIATGIRGTFDPDAITQIVLILVGNALQYTTHGSISLRGEIVRDAVRVEVLDTGPGISPEHLAHLFERFYRVDTSRGRDRGGAGLGLAIAKELALAHGGDVQVESRVGQGSCFTLVLPLLRR